MTIAYRIEAKNIGDILIRLSKKNLQKKGFVDFRLLKEWGTIMSSLLINKDAAVPIKITNIKGKRVLYIKSLDLSFKTDFKYNEEKLIELINQNLPYDSNISSIKLIK